MNCLRGVGIGGLAAALVVLMGCSGGTTKPTAVATAPAVQPAGAGMGAGGGQAQPGGAGNPARVANDLKEIGLAYVRYWDKNAGQAPKSIDDLEPLIQTKTVVQAVRDGKYVVFWGARALDIPKGTNNSTIIAHERDADAGGKRQVVFADNDGSVKSLDQQEFDKAAKAVKQ